MEQELKRFLEDLRALRSLVRGEKHERISKKQIRQRSEGIASAWFTSIANRLSANYTFGPGLVDKYSAQFNRLLKLAENNNLKTSCLSTLDSVTRGFREDLVLPVQRNEVKQTVNTAFAAFLTGLSDVDESAYFKEALDCADHGFLRAAAVMGWSAAIDRIHRRVEQLGFTTFNTVSAQMAGQTKGRFKHFNQKQAVASISDLRETFDTVVLWIIEGMNLIDVNQHMRLRSCFEMRCQCAHPGEAPVTEYNLMSFFSDIQKIVFENPAFQI